MRRLVRIQVIAFAGAILLARSVVADDWPYYQHDASHTGDSSAEVSPKALSLAWTAPSPPPSTTGYSTPVIVGNTIYATQLGINGSQTTVSSFDLSTGAINWSYTGNFKVPSQAGVGGGFVTFVGPTSSDSSLYVLDATTGMLRYTVPIPESVTSLMPTVFRDTISGNVTAFVADGTQVSAVSLGPVSGSVLWTQFGKFGGQSIPTVVGSSIVIVGPGQYYAFDQVTGAENQFWSGGETGGGGTAVAYDAAHQQFYVLEDYNDPTPTLSAYHYTDNDHITLLWQRTGAGIGGGGSVAIGPTGNVYSAGDSVIWELDPATGTTLRFISGTFASGVTPALTNNVLWIIGESQVFAYDLVTLQLLRAFNGSRGSLNTAYDSPGAFADGYFVLDYGVNYESHSFDVYSAPNPTPTATPTATSTPSSTPTATPTPRATPSPRPRPTPRPHV
jgi:outer membrane protein assembly factor BamB